jgi:hypothetical protein
MCYAAALNRPSTTRSAVVNRPLFVRGADGRTAAARRFRDIASSLIADLGGDITESQMLLVRQAAMTSLQVEQLQARIVSGGDVDPELLIRLTNSQTRTLQELNLTRGARMTEIAQ